MRTFRCPVDDVVFTTKYEDREPTLEGHPECPGPECQKNFDKPASRRPVSVSGEASASVVPTLSRPPVGQGW